VHRLYKLYGMEEVTVFETTPKMLAKNYFADIMGINLKYALEAYDWEGIRETGEGCLRVGHITKLLEECCNF